MEDAYHQLVGNAQRFIELLDITTSDEEEDELVHNIRSTSVILSDFLVAIWDEWLNDFDRYIDMFVHEELPEWFIEDTLERFETIIRLRAPIGNRRRTLMEEDETPSKKMKFI